MISRIALIVFLITIGFSEFIAIPYVGFIIGVSAIIAGIAMIFGK